MNTVLWILLIIFIVVVCWYNYKVGVRLERAGGIREELDDGMKIIYRYKNSAGVDVRKEVQNGEKIDHLIAVEPPQVVYPAAVDGKYYTLLLVDPDARTIPTNSRMMKYMNPGIIPRVREWRHWAVGNIPGSVLNSEAGVPVSGFTITEYGGPMPPIGSGSHHYYFKLYEQSGLLSFSPLNSMRLYWKPDGLWKSTVDWSRSHDWAELYGLKKIAQTYFLAERTHRASHIQQ